ncbi:nagb/rpia/CoA transferase-like protein [Caulochytrium protostelioides]|nr:nagb/rpia/CoA transferase-like protein [Caulochytrium protostelioides]
MIATAGSLLVAEVAKACKRPIIVCSGMYKVSPLGLMQQQEVLSLNSCPNGVYDFEEGDVVERVEVVNPHYDFVPAELISVLVTNMGTHPPSYMSHMLDDVYSKLDLVI